MARIHAIPGKMNTDLFNESITTSPSQILRSRQTSHKARACWHPECLMGETVFHPSSSRTPKYNKQIFYTSALCIIFLKLYLILCVKSKSQLRVILLVEILNSFRFSQINKLLLYYLGKCNTKKGFWHDGNKHVMGCWQTYYGIASNTRPKQTT